MGAVLLSACAGDALTQETPTQAVVQPTATTASNGAAGGGIAVAPTTAASATATTELASTTEPTATTAPSPTSAPLTPTPQCTDDDDEPTIAQTEGPYYTPDSPERTSFLADGPGTPMIVTGRVITTSCVPVANALVDLWHADDSGAYDNVGYNFRGHQFTDANGVYRFETVRPGLYPGRTRHFHVKVQGPNMGILTTQLYFPNEPDNARDGIYNAALLMDVQEANNGLTGTYDFVI